MYIYTYLQWSTFVLLRLTIESHTYGTFENRKENVYSQLPTLDEVPLCEEPVRSIAPKEQAIWAQVVLSTAVTLTQPFWMWEAATGRSPKMLRLYVNHVWHLHQILWGTIVPRVYCCFSSEKTLQFPPNQTTLTWRYLNCQRKPAIDPKQHMFSSKIPTGEPLPMILIKLEMDFYLLLGPRIGLTILGDKFAASQLFDWHSPQNSTFLIRIIPYGLCFLEALTILSPLFFDEI